MKQIQLQPLSGKEKKKNDQEQYCHLKSFDPSECHKKIVNDRCDDKNIQNIEDCDVLEIDQEININDLP